MPTHGGLPQEKAHPEAAHAFAGQEAQAAEGQGARASPELYGLGLVALGTFLGVVLYGGWDGGIVGGKLADGVRGLLGAAAYFTPIGCVGVGA